MAGLVMTRDDIMALANQTAGQHWMDEAHIQRFAALVALRAALAEPVQEPVGVVTSMVKGGVTWHRWPSDMPDGTKLYTAPPQRKPLTEEEIRRIYETHRASVPLYHSIARAIERAHGIGGQK